MTEAKATPPIILAEDLDVTFFHDLESAELYMEPDDIRDGVYIAFDSTGMPLILGVDGFSASIRIDPGSTRRPELLTQILRDCIASIGKARVGVIDLDRTPLDILVVKLGRFMGIV